MLMLEIPNGGTPLSKYSRKFALSDIVYYNSVMQNYSFKKGFTLSEVLITLGVIAVVAALTIPTLVNKYQEKQFKTAYKKAYSDLQQVLIASLAYNEMPYRSSANDIQATINEFEKIRSGLIVSKQCSESNFYECWAKGDTLCGGACTSGNIDDGIDMENGAPNPSSSLSLQPFLDLSGRSWVVYESSQNIYLVDTNGLSGPNQFGKDRWVFTFADKNNSQVKIGYPKKIKPFVDTDITTITAFCKHPPCYYNTWLYER